MGRHRQPDLAKVVLAPRFASRIAGGTDRGHQHRNQNPDNRHDHQQLDRGEPRSLTVVQYLSRVS